MTNLSNRAPVLNAFARAIRASGKSKANEIKLMLEAGHDQGDTRELCIVTRMSMTMGITTKEAALILALPNSKSKAAHKRTAEQDTHVNSARKYWSRLLLDGGIKSESKSRGNANARKTEKATPKPAATQPVNATPIAIPAVTNVNEVHEAMRAFAALLKTFAQKSGKAFDVDSRNIVSEFETSVKALGKREPKPLKK